MFIKQRKKMRKKKNNTITFFFVSNLIILFRSDTRDYALKQIEGNLNSYEGIIPTDLKEFVPMDLWSSVMTVLLNFRPKILPVDSSNDP